MNALVLNIIPQAFRQTETDRVFAATVWFDISTRHLNLFGISKYCDPMMLQWFYLPGEYAGFSRACDGRYSAHKGCNKQLFSSSINLLIIFSID